MTTTPAGPVRDAGPTSIRHHLHSIPDPATI